MITRAIKPKIATLAVIDATLKNDFVSFFQCSLADSLLLIPFFCLSFLISNVIKGVKTTLYLIIAVWKNMQDPNWVNNQGKND